MKLISTLILATVASISLATCLSQPQTQVYKLPLYTSRCDTSDLTSYSVSIRDQIAYLCEQGFTKQEAISGMRQVISNSSINPDQAYQIVLLGRKIQNYDPLTKANH